MSNICQNCKQHRATVHLTEIDSQSNEPHEMHLCESCARETGATGAPPSGAYLSHVTVADLASSALASGTGKAESKRGASKRASCTSCGMSYQEFRVKGRFGCASCYNAFEDGLVTLLEKVHGASQYVGDYPNGVEPTARTQAAIAQELGDLRRRLGLVIKNEEYEEAARVRDRIAELEQLQKEPSADE
jgi:protein arginine kinase activator